MSFLLCMKDFKTIFEMLQAPTKSFSWPHLPKILGFLVLARSQVLARNWKLGQGEEDLNQTLKCENV